MNELRECRLCPRDCRVNRYLERGFCGAGAKVEVARAMLHPWEEPCLTGEKGAGAVFFAHCNLRCLYCQNHLISQETAGKPMETEELAQLFLGLAAEGAATLDLVTPSHYAPQIIAALDIAKGQNLSLPVVYNSGGYESLATLDSLRGYVDIFLPDIKYFYKKTAAEYSSAADYFSAASQGLKRMVEIVGEPIIDSQGLMRRGVLVRHLILPGHRRESMALISWLWENFGDGIYLSLLSQYTPLYRAKEHPPLDRRLTTFEYESVVNCAARLGFTRCFVQDRSSASETYVPDFKSDSFAAQRLHGGE